MNYNARLRYTICMINLSILYHITFPLIFFFFCAGMATAGLEVREAGRALRVQTEAPHLVSTGSGRLSTAVTLHPLPEGKACLSTCAWPRIEKIRWCVWRGCIELHRYISIERWINLLMWWNWNSFWLCIDVWARTLENWD